MFRIPGFQETIFPKESMPIINLVANLGLILFLFLIALEVDMQLFIKNWRVALSVGLAGMLLPFGLGFGIAWGLYHQFRTDEGIVPISFGVYGLFIGTALSITAFPVLCRILTELNLLGTPVGVTVLAAGVGNDVVGWVLLALCVALVNNGSGITALYVVLCTIGWILFLCFLVRPALLWLLRRNGSIENGPSQGMVTLIILMTLFSSWFTGIIGVHPIFGGFLVGLICPHDEGFTVKLTEKIEDLVTVLFLPLYFTLSGLNTNLGLLSDGMAWAYVVGVIAVAFAGKIIGGTLAARSCGLVWRESLTIGSLMSCKGLVELIVLVSTAFTLNNTNHSPDTADPNFYSRTSVSKPRFCLPRPSRFSSLWLSLPLSLPHQWSKDSIQPGTRRSSSPGSAVRLTGMDILSATLPTPIAMP